MDPTEIIIGIYVGASRDSPLHRTKKVTTLHLNPISIKPAEPKQHFAAIAQLMNTQDSEPNTAETLAEWYGKQH